MTSIASRSGVADLALLDELMASDVFWSDRDAEAEAVANHLLRTTSSIVVLHGPRRSGKTELIRRRVVPLVSRYRVVRFRDGSEPTASSAPDGAESIEFWDSFESSLIEDDAARGEVVRDLRKALDGRDGCRVVLVIADDALKSLLKLCAEIPEVVEDVRELPRVATRSLLERLQGLTTHCGVNIADSFLRALATDLTAGSTAASAELAAIVVFEICRLKPPGNNATDEYYHSSGRLAGILETHLNWLLERLPDAVDPQIGWAVLSEIVAIGGASGHTPDLAEIASRFDVPPAAPTQVLAWLEETRRIVHRRTSGDYDLVPASMALAVRARQQREVMADEHHRWLLRQATRTGGDAEDLIPPQVFSRIHARRSAMKLSDEETTTLLRCALVYEDSDLEGATRYWLRRVVRPDIQVDTLLEAIFDSRTNVRRRAAQYLKTFNRSDVRNQLHLLALRDPDEAVRAQAVDSLDAIKDDALQASLIKELDDPNSPYRLQAIDALRIFDTRTATDALVRIVQTNQAGQDLDGRQRAIEALGRKQSISAADALLEVAVQDRDAEDRERAAQALGSMSSRPTLRYVLDRLHELTRSAKAWRLSLSWRTTGLWLFNAALGLGVVLANVFLPGVVMLTMRRWRLGLVVIAMGVAAIVLLSLSYAEAGISLFFVSVLAGLLIPFRLLVLERTNSIPVSWYRRCLGVTVFVSCLLPFLYFHGLACMLTRRIRRGLVLMAFEALGILLLVGNAYVEAEFAAFNELSAIFGWVSTSFAIIAAVLLAVTFLVGIGTVWVDAFGFQDRRRRLQRIGDVQTAMSSNAQLPSLLLDDCLGTDRRKGRWSRRIFRKFGHRMGGGLRDRWQQADVATRRAIFSIMARRHDTASMEFLEVVAPSLGWGARVRYAWASLTFRVSLWPTPLLIAVALVSYVQVAALAVLYARMVTDPGRLANTVGDTNQAGDIRTEALDRLRQLAAQNRNTAVANIARTSLTNLVTEPRFAHESDELRLAALRAVAAIGRVEERQPLIEAVARLLDEPTLRAQAVTTLTALGSVDALRRLKTFIEKPLQRGAEGEVKTREEAILALAMIGGVDTFDVLTALGASTALDPALKKRVYEVLASFDPLVQAESLVTKGEYTDAVALATRMLAVSDPERRSRASDLLSTAYTLQGSSALNARQFSQAKASLMAALDLRAPSGSNPGLTGLGLNFAYLSHEEEAPNDPRAYNDVYDVIQKLSSLDTDRESALSIRANLVEASLTTGRHDDAVRLGRELIADPGLNPIMSLNMRFIVYTALVLDGKPSDAAREDLRAHYQRQKGFRNEWGYAGTRAYIERSQIPDSDKTQLLLLLSQIETPTPAGR